MSARAAAGADRLLRPASILLAALFLVLLFPAFLIIAIAIWGDTGMPIFFRQQRVGHRGRPFTILKFRTLRVDAHPYGESPQGLQDRRITRVGRVLRRCAVDELPQLINILRGEMLFVGPRPQLREELEALRPSHAELIELREQAIPGMTSPWVIAPEGLKSLPTHEMLLADCDYVLHRSFWLDVRTLAGTAFHLLGSRGRAR